MVTKAFSPSRSICLKTRTANRRWARTCPPRSHPLTTHPLKTKDNKMQLPDIEIVSAKVHEAWMDSTNGDILREQADALGMPLRTLDQVKECFVKKLRSAPIERIA